MWNKREKFKKKKQVKKQEREGEQPKSRDDVCMWWCSTVLLLLRSQVPQWAGNQSHLLAAVYCHLLMHSQRLLNLTVNDQGGNGEGCRPWAALQQQSGGLFWCSPSIPPGHLSFIYIGYVQAHHHQRLEKTCCVFFFMHVWKQEHKASWRPLCPVCALPENPSPLGFLSSTSPGRPRTRRGGNGRSPRVQPSERERQRWKCWAQIVTGLTFHSHENKWHLHRSYVVSFKGKLKDVRKVSKYIQTAQLHFWKI